jgi:hypothetical protein
LETLLERWRTQRQLPDLGHIAELVLRVAEAIAYAHRRGVVHRDLKPANVIVGALGAVHVIDWGLAGTVAERGGTPPRSGGTLLATSHEQTTAGTLRLGTPAWMAPEQFHGAPPDPRMDVFALGGLLMALLTGRHPRTPDATGGATDLTPLDRRGLPRGLVAVARRCLAREACERYADAEAVAAELRRWQSAGLTQAERPGPLVRLLAHLRHSPRLLAAGFGVALAGVLTVGAIGVQRANERAAAIAEVGELGALVNLGDEQDVRATRTRIAFLLRDHPGLPEALSLKDQLQAVEDSFTAQHRLDRHRSLLAALQRRYRTSGPWPGEIDDLLAALTEVGFPPDDDLASGTRLKDDRLCVDVLITLAQLQRAYLIDDVSTPLRTRIPQLMALVAPTPGWAALGPLLTAPQRAGHDLLCDTGSAAEAALSESLTADVILATFAPQPHLVRAAWERWHEDTAAFWPRIMAGRDCLARRDWRTAERHALVALGSEPDSLWPHLILAHVALADGDWPALLREADAGRVENPDHMELVVLSAIGLARSGRQAQAQALIDDCGRADLLQYHRLNPGHLLANAVRALEESGVKIAPAEPRLAPLVLRTGGK